MSETPEFVPDSEKSKKSPRGFPRRDFLKKIGLVGGALVLGFYGLDTGARRKKEMEIESSEIEDKGLDDDEIQKGLEKFQKEIKDPNDYLKYLKNREVIVRDEIFDAFSKTVDKISTRVDNKEPVGGYLARNFLDTKTAQQEFQDRLKTLGLTGEEVGFYQKLFSSSDLIIFRESILQTEYFLYALPHERFHKNLGHLDDEEYIIMAEAAKKVITRYKEDRLYLYLQEERAKGKNTYRTSAPAAGNNWEEFYTYLAGGDFGKEPEKLLAQEYPKAYQIYQEILESTKLTE